MDSPANETNIMSSLHSSPQKEGDLPGLPPASQKRPALLLPSSPQKEGDLPGLPPASQKRPALLLPSSPQKEGDLPGLPPASRKRPASSLLAAFVPSSSPEYSHSPAKRVRRHSPSPEDAIAKDQSPIPTTTTRILSSFHPRLGPQPDISADPDREPLQGLKSIILPENGEEILIGRSSISSHFQLSTNRLISRVHVRARYVPPPASFLPSKVEIVCVGWNGMMLHCEAQTHEIRKGDCFELEPESGNVLLDVHDARVMIEWPRKDDLETNEERRSSDRDQERTSAAVVGQGPPLYAPVSPIPGEPRHTTSASGPSTLAPFSIFEDDSEDNKSV